MFSSHSPSPSPFDSYYKLVASPPLLSLQKHIPLTSKHIFQDLISLFQTTFMNVKSWTEPNPSPSSGKKLGAITCSKQSRHILSSFILFPRNTWLRDFCLKDEQNLVFIHPQVVPSMKSSNSQLFKSTESSGAIPLTFNNSIAEVHLFIFIYLLSIFI